MTKRVTVEELAANLEAHLEDVKRGETLALVENGADVVTLQRAPDPGVSFAQRADRTIRLGDFDPAGLGRPLDVDVVTVLREDRDNKWTEWDAS